MAMLPSFPSLQSLASWPHGVLCQWGERGEGHPLPLFSSPSDTLAPLSPLMAPFFLPHSPILSAPPQHPMAPSLLSLSSSDTPSHPQTHMTSCSSLLLNPWHPILSHPAPHSLMALSPKGIIRPRMVGDATSVHFAPS